MGMHLSPGGRLCLCPQYFSIFGFARSSMSDAEFRDYISGSLSCRLSEPEKCVEKMGVFLERCFYQTVRTHLLKTVVCGCRSVLCWCCETGCETSV
jgi:hypothetical protein